MKASLYIFCLRLPNENQADFYNYTKITVVIIMFGRSRTDDLNRRDRYYRYHLKLF